MHICTNYYGSMPGAMVHSIAVLSRGDPGSVCYLACCTYHHIKSRDETHGISQLSSQKKHQEHSHQTTGVRVENPDIDTLIEGYTI